MEITVTHLPPVETGISARVWRADGQWTDVELLVNEGETVEQAIALIQSELPEWIAIEITVSIVRAIPINVNK